MKAVRSTPWRYAGIAIFALALVARVFWIARLSDRLTWDDEQQFVEVARHLAAGEGYVSDSYRANPVLPFLLSLVFRLFGENYFLARLGQSIVGAATCLILYRLGVGLLGRRAGAIAGLWLALYPPHVYLAGVLYAEVMATFFVVLSVYLAARGIQNGGHHGFALVTGMSLGLTALTRPIFLGCVPAVMAAWLYGARIPMRRRVALCLALALGSAITVLPWTVRNYGSYGRVVPVSSGFYTKLWQGNNEVSDGGPHDRDLLWNTDEWRRRLSLLDDLARHSVTDRYAGIDAVYQKRLEEHGDRFLASDEAVRPIVLRDMCARPLRTLSLMGRKVVTLYSAFSATLTSNRYTTTPFKQLAALSFYPLLVLALAGAGLGVADRARLAPLYAVLASVTAAYALLNTCTRFRLPLDPVLILFASFAVVRLGEWLDAARHRQTLPS